MPENSEHWRWNADPVWHYFCSMQFGAVSAKSASADFMRYHHLRSCIYFAVGVIEAFLNKEMRLKLEEEKASEEDIFNELRRTPFDHKRDEWPSRICKKPIKFANEMVEIFETYREIRNEITHPKRRDHSIYLDLDRVNSDVLVSAVGRALVNIYEGKGTAFPYWVLGWNYVGMNGDPALPAQLNNMNAFVWSLRAMGFSAVPNDPEWDRKHMRSVLDYNSLKALLDRYPRDIEPFSPRFPQKPRLTRRWWDRDFIMSDVAAARAS